VADGKLRYFAADGTRVLGPEESALREMERAAQERQRADRLAQRLRELGVDPEA